VPEGWSTVTLGLFYDDIDAAIEWLERVFGLLAHVKIPGPDGRTLHAELMAGEQFISIEAASRDGAAWQSPRSLGGMAHAIYVYVADVDAHAARSRSEGATIDGPLEDKHYGDRTYSVLDLEGHRWTFQQRISPADVRA
jgi:uncharacterized glyoxalase superfamily protein PhnB